MKIRKHSKGSVAFVALANVLWGINVPIVKIGVAEIPIFFYGAIKMSVALVVVSFMLKGHWKRLNKRTWLYVISSGFLLGFAANALYYFGLSKISGLLGSVIMLITPLLVFIFSAEFLKERATTRNVLGIIFAAAGAFLVVLSPVEANNTLTSFSRTGVTAIIIGGVLAAIGTVLAKPALNRATPQQETFIRILCAWVGYTIFSFVFQEYQPLSTISGIGWSSLVISTGIVITATSLFNNGLQGISGEEAGLLDYLRPVFGVVASILLLSESPTTGFLIGAILVFLGTYVTEARLPIRLHAHHHQH